MRNDLDLEKEFKIFEQNENHFEFFREFILEYLNIDVQCVSEVIERLFKICKARKYDVAEKWCILYLGWVENCKGNLIEAIKLHTSAMAFFEENEISLGYGASYNALLVDYIQTGYLNLTIENCMKCIKVCETLNNYDLITAVMINTIHVFIENNYYDEAKFLLDRLNIYKHNYRPDYEIEIDIIKAAYNLEKNQFEEVDKNCNNALKIIDKEGFFNWKYRVYYIIAQKLYKKGMYKEGREKFKEAIILSKEYEDKFMEAKLLIQMAVCEYKANEYDISNNALLTGLDIIKNKEYLGLKEKANYYLSKVNEEYALYDKAYIYLKKSLKYKKMMSQDNNLGMNDLKYKNIFYAAEEYKELYKKIENISNLCKNITSNLDIKDCTKEIFRVVSELVDTSIFGIAIYEEDENILNYIMLFMDGKIVEDVVHKVDSENSLATYCFKEKNNVLINNMDKEYSKYKYKFNVYSNPKEILSKSIIYIPLIVQNKSIGVMTIQSKNANAYSINDLNELKILSSYVAIAIKNLQLFNKVKYFAEHDTLTGTYNRNKILSIANQIYEDKKYEKFSIAMIDVDKFKSINDSFGHVTGDFILKNICGIIKQNLCKNSYFGRYGGEEFLIIFEGKSEKEVYEICESFRNEIKNFENILEEDNKITATVTIGVYEFNKNDSLVDGIKKADKALYVGKDNGRNKTVLYSLL